MLFLGNKKRNEISTNILYVECECGTHLVEFISDEDDTEVYINFYTDNFYSKQTESFFSRWKSKIKYIWYVLKGRQYVLEEIVIDKKDINLLIDGLKKIQKQEVKQQ